MGSYASFVRGWRFDSFGRAKLAMTPDGIERDALCLNRSPPTTSSLR